MKRQLTLALTLTSISSLLASGAEATSLWNERKRYIGYTHRSHARTSSQ